MEPATIDIKNAREHNLKEVSLSLPRNALICFTGVSGSGKSSLAFDTLYAEGQRRYIESLSSYARQFMGQMQKPDCDLITGLSPAIAIQQKTAGWNPRSTVGTVTAIHDFLRVLYARIGVQHCTACGKLISAQSLEQIVAGILAAFGSDSNAARSTSPTAPQAALKNPRSAIRNPQSEPRPRRPIRSLAATNPQSAIPNPQSPIRNPQSTRVLILAPVARGQKGEFRDLFDDLIRAGYVRARVDGEVVALREDLALEKNRRHDIEVVIDRLAISPDSRSRIAEAVSSALRVGKGTLIVARMEEAGAALGQGAKRARSAAAAEKVFSSKYACPTCGISFEPPTPQLFSFNSPTGMCMKCDGLGELFDFDPDLLVPNPSLNIYAPCIAPMRTKPGKWRRHIYEGVAKALGFDLRTPWKDLPQAARDAMLLGTGDRHITYAWRWSGGVWKHGGPFEGVIEELREKYRKAGAAFVREYYQKFMRRGPCPECAGARLNPQALAVRLAIQHEKNSVAKSSRTRVASRDSKWGGPLCPPQQAGTPAPLHSEPAGTHLQWGGPPCPPKQPGTPAPLHSKPARASRWALPHNGPNLHELCSMSITDAYELLGRLELTPVQQTIADEVLKEIRSRMEFLLNVGLHYLALDRTAPTLSGGELQRIRLAGQIGAGLVGVLYVLDEPSIGLHARDNERLLESLAALRDMGNTVVVVEHDEATMRAADHIVDFGPGPGVRGGEIVASGTFEDIVAKKESLTGQYLTGEQEIPIPKRRAVARSKLGSRPTIRHRNQRQSRIMQQGVTES